MSFVVNLSYSIYYPKMHTKTFSLAVWRSVLNQCANRPRNKTKQFSIRAVTVITQ